MNRLKEAAKDLMGRNRREMRECSLRVAAPLLCCLPLAVVGIVFGSFVSLCILSDDNFFSRVQEFSYSNAYNYSYSSTPTSNNILSCNGGGENISAGFGGLGELVGPKEVWHSMSDEELMWRSSMVPRVEEYPYRRTAKVAFMFLSRGRMPLRLLWERFFKGYDGLFSIYLHTSPDFKEEAPEGSVFFKRRIPSKPVEWGRITMIDAERRLLANALLDFSNERFILLSETCIPLFNFTTIYNYLINSNHSFLGSFDDPRPMGRGRYNKRMWPTVSIHDWRKGSQWFEVQRKLAIEIASDRKYYPVFRDHCRPSCYVDEHYLPTLVTKLFPELNSCRTITWVDWSVGGSHPSTFRRRDVSEGFLNLIRHGSKCMYNGNASSICFLFARKFDGSTLGPLLQIAPRLMGFDP